MFLRRKTVLYFCPHQDDELLTMGIGICSDIRRKNNVHVILCTDGSQSSIRKALHNGKRCSLHEGTHCYDLSTDEFVLARDREFMDSCKALGIKEANIHIPEKRDIDGSLSVENAEYLIQHYLSIFGNNALVCTIAPDNGPSQHRDHKILGTAANQLLYDGVLRDVRFFIEPYHFTQIKDNSQLIPANLTITKASARIGNKIDAAIYAYSCWDPEDHRYAIGYHSVTTVFEDFRKAKNSYSFMKHNPK